MKYVESSSHIGLLLSVKGKNNEDKSLRDLRVWGPLFQDFLHCWRVAGDTFGVKCVLKGGFTPTFHLTHISLILCVPSFIWFFNLNPNKTPSKLTMSSCSKGHLPHKCLLEKRHTTKVKQWHADVCDWSVMPNSSGLKMPRGTIASDSYNKVPCLYLCDCVLLHVGICDHEWQKIQPCKRESN